MELSANTSCEAKDLPTVNELVNKMNDLRFNE